MKSLISMVVVLSFAINPTSAKCGNNDIWGMIFGEVEVESSSCTGASGATENGTTCDSVSGTHGVADQYGLAYTAYKSTHYYSVNAGSNPDEQTIFDFGMISDTQDDLSTVGYEAEYELLHAQSGTGATTVYVTYDFGSQGNSG